MVTATCSSFRTCLPLTSHTTAWRQPSHFKCRDFPNPAVISFPRQGSGGSKTILSQAANDPRVALTRISPAASIISAIGSTRHQIDVRPRHEHVDVSHRATPRHSFVSIGLPRLVPHPCRDRWNRHERKDPALTCNTDGGKELSPVAVSRWPTSRDTESVVGPES